MPGLLDFLQERGSNALGLLQRVGPLGGLLNPQTLSAHVLAPTLRNDLKDTAHGVSRGMSADLLGAPVDLVSQVMSIPNYLGAPTPNFAGRTPVGGSDWLGQKMESLGLLRPMTGSANEVAGRLLGGVLSSPGAVAAVGQTAEQAALQAIRNAAIPNRMNPQTGAIVWHGSPHKFDKFNAAKIGTGEGMNSYGMGHYSAEERKVAEDTLRNILQVNPGDTLSYKTGNPKQFNELNRALLGARSEMNNATTREAMLAAREKVSLFESKIRDAQNAVLPKGYIYKIDLPDEQIAKMLDWDKSIKDQPNILRALEKDNRGPLPDMFKNMTGEQLHNWFQNSRGEEPIEIASFFKKLGIPGIRYLDEGSRGAGKGTSNYVVFPGNEGLLKILERNGRPVNSNRLSPQAGMINLRDTRYVMPDGKRLGGTNDSTHESIAKSMIGKADPDAFIRDTGAVRMNIAADMVSGKPYTVDLAKAPTDSQFNTIVEYIQNAKRPVTVYTPNDVIEINPTGRVGMNLRRAFRKAFDA